MVDEHTIKCARCKKPLDAEIHASGYSSDGPEPPFYCSEECWGSSSRLLEHKKLFLLLIFVLLLIPVIVIWRLIV